MTLDISREPHPLALLSHELLTPLNAVLGYADAMRAEAFGPLPARYLEQAGVIHDAASHLLALVDAMTAIGETEAGQRALAFERLGPADLEALMSGAARHLAARACSANLELRTVSAGEAFCDVRADRLALTQVLINLIDNAVKFAAPGGTITLGLEGDAAHLCLTVGNDGGAAPTTGRGLGLRLARALSEAMGGSLTLDLSPGGGARAAVRLPAITTP